MIRWRTDNASSAVVELLKAFPIGNDPDFRGELARLKENSRFRKHWRKGGVTLDGFGELLTDRNLVVDRPTPDDLLCYFEDLFQPVKRKVGRKRVSTRSMDDALQHAKNVRFRLYECACGQKIRGTRKTSVVCGRCLESVFTTIAAELATEVLQDERIVTAIMTTVRQWVKPLERKDPLPEEIEQSILIAESERAA
jgi:hypothetical protein